MTTLNLTQHLASEPQIEAGVVEPEDKAAVKAKLTATITELLEAI